MIPLLRLTLCAFATSFAAGQSIQDLGVSGGNGSRGGIGDAEHPVLRAQAFITDAQIPTTPNSTRQLADGPAPVHSSTNATNSTAGCVALRNVVIDSSAAGAKQEMVGFGHSWTDSTVSVFDSLEPEVLDQVMEDLFGQTGNNMGFMRHTIGSSDLSGVPYSYDDNGPGFNLGEPDVTLADFSLGPYGTAMASLIARMGQYKGDVFLFGAPWSYPGWLKNNDLFIAPNIINYGNQYPLLNNSLNIGYVPQVVEYFTRYLDAFKQYGISINGLSLMNEPLNYQGKQVWHSHWTDLVGIKDTNSQKLLRS
jgi:glucan endo-1,6-beta-glucosidase